MFPAYAAISPRDKYGLMIVANPFHQPGDEVIPVPAEYQRIRDHLYKFLEDARDIADVGTTHRSYTMSQGVFQTFRRRLEIKDVIEFSYVLPAGIRALFVAEWDTNEPIKEFTDKESMNREVRSLRADHNFSPETAIQDVARALRKNVDEEKLELVLHKLSPGARDFWAVD